MKSGSLNLLEPSGPVQGCNGTALPLQSVLPYEQNLPSFHTPHIFWLFGRFCDPAGFCHTVTLVTLCSVGSRFEPEPHHRLILPRVGRMGGSAGKLPTRGAEPATGVGGNNAVSRPRFPHAKEFLRKLSAVWGTRPQKRSPAQSSTEKVQRISGLRGAELFSLSLAPT